MINLIISAFPYVLFAVAFAMAAASLADSFSKICRMIKQ